MFTNSEFDRIYQTFLKKQTERKAMLKKTWGILLGLVLFVCIVLFLVFPNQFNDGDTAWIMPTYGGMAFLATFLGLMISISFFSEKPFFEYLYDEVYKMINMNEGLFLEYKPYDKESKLFNKEGGLFANHASLVVRRHVNGDTEEHHKFHVYDVTMTTSSGKSQQTHFDGIYYIVQNNLSTSLQIRSNGSPKLKGVKFEKQPEFEEFRVYKEVGQTMLNIDHQLVQFYKKLISYEEYKKVYLSVVNGEVHLALWHKKHPARKQKVIDLSKMNELANYFLGEYNLVNEIANIDVF